MPDSTKPDSVHGVPSGGGHGGLIAGGIIMLLLAGGLVVWKLQSGEKEPEVITEQAPLKPTEPAPQVAADAAPPPPPPEEEIEEEEKKEETTTKTAKPIGPAGCSGDCAGKMTPFRSLQLPLDACTTLLAPDTGSSSLLRYTLRDAAGRGPVSLRAYSLEGDQVLE